MNIKTEIIGAVLLGLITIGLVLWYMSEHPAPYINQPNLTDFAGTAGKEGNPVSLNETAAYYEIVASYPSSTGLKATAGVEADTKAVALMRAFETDSIATFKKEGNFENLSHDDVQILGLDQRKESLEIAYQSKTTPRTLSYIYTITADTLGAHPNTYFRTFTFDRATGAPLNLKDLFTPGSDYLRVLSTQSRKLLIASIAAREGVTAADVDTDYLNRGTGPDADNFANWYVEGSSLVLIFPPYQVAPYAAGVQMATVPLSQLANILNPAYK